MTSEIKSYGELANELNQAKNSLKDYDENIKRLIGRDPSESNQRNGKRGAPNQNDRFQDNSFSRQRNHNRNQNYGNQNNFNTDEPPIKKRSMDSSVFKRLDKRPSDLEDLSPSRMQMPSRVIVTPREVPSRQDALKAQDRDEKSKARNRRMFGALLGTLQKFRQEETKLKPKVSLTVSDISNQASIFPVVSKLIFGISGTKTCSSRKEIRGARSNGTRKG